MVVDRRRGALAVAGHAVPGQIEHTHTRLPVRLAHLRERRGERAPQQVEQRGVLPPVVIDELLGVPHLGEQPPRPVGGVHGEHAGVEHRGAGIAILRVPSEPDVADGCVDLGEQIAIEVDDDGVGIDPEHVLVGVHQLADQLQLAPGGRALAVERFAGEHHAPVVASRVGNHRRRRLGHQLTMAAGGKAADDGAVVAAGRGDNSAAPDGRHQVGDERHRRIHPLSIAVHSPAPQPLPRGRRSRPRRTASSCTSARARSSR